MDRENRRNSDERARPSPVLGSSFAWTRETKCWAGGHCGSHCRHGRRALPGPWPSEKWHFLFGGRWWWDVEMTMMDSRSGARGADADRKSGVVEIGPICQAIGMAHWAAAKAKSGGRDAARAEAWQNQGSFLPWLTRSNVLIIWGLFGVGGLLSMTQLPFHPTHGSEGGPEPEWNSQALLPLAELQVPSITSSFTTGIYLPTSTRDLAG